MCRRRKAALAQTRDAFIPSADIRLRTSRIALGRIYRGLPSILSGTVQSLVFSLPQMHYIEAARAGVKAAALSLKDAREQVALDASTTYIELDTVNRELDAARQQETLRRGW